MRLVAAVDRQLPAESEIETLVLSPDQLAFLDQLSRDLDPAVPLAFGRPHAVRTLLETLEEAQIRKARRRR
ncbi:MAG TPA: hypothetical protein VM779_12245 [Thermoanaerobaculia bacterium]|nr:hypothetical protein [Thermoanaerobaculia bacterium]